MSTAKSWNVYRIQLRITRTESTKSQVTPNFDLPVDKFSDMLGYYMYYSLAAKLSAGTSDFISY